MRSDIFSNQAIPTGGAEDKHPLFIDQLHGQAIHFGFGDIGQRIITFQIAMQLFFKILQLGPVKDIIQTEHGRDMPNLFKTWQGLAADPPGRRIRRNKLGVALLQFKQTPK